MVSDSKMRLEDGPKDQSVCSGCTDIWVQICSTYIKCQAWSTHACKHQHAPGSVDTLLQSNNKEGKKKIPKVLVQPPYVGMHTQIYISMYHIAHTIHTITPKTEEISK